jgi:hypothetical protein
MTMSEDIHPNHARQRALLRDLCGDHAAERYVLADVPYDADHDALGVYGNGMSYATSGIVVDTATYDIVGYDGGEPEDQTLGRDWSWVVDALNAAFRAGRESAAR